MTMNLERLTEIEILYATDSSQIGRVVSEMIQELRTVPKFHQHCFCYTNNRLPCCNAGHRDEPLVDLHFDAPTIAIPADDGECRFCLNQVRAGDLIRFGKSSGRPMHDECSITVSRALKVFGT